MPLVAEGFLRSGKVRDLYALADGRLALVASDRISAFDVVLPTTIPDKGRVLTGLSRFWFAETARIVANHLLPTDIDLSDDLRGRVMLCRRTEVVPIEAVVRGYLAGSGWKEYHATGTVCGIPLPAGLRESDRLPEPILTPATKAEQGEHDENIDFDAMVGLVGGEIADRIRSIALRLYGHAAEVAAPSGILLADTKFEFGIEPSTGELLLIDEVLTPDSSRFWPADQYAAGRPQPSFDKQPLRDWLDGERRAGRWDGNAPPPPLPGHVVSATSDRYLDAFCRLTGAPLDTSAL